MQRARNNLHTRSSRHESHRDLSPFETAFKFARKRASTRVGKLVEQVKHEGEEFLAGRKDMIAEQFVNVSGAIRRAADKLHDSESALIGDYADRAADTVEDVGRYIEQNDMGGMIESVRTVARKRPLLFGGGMLLAGLAAAQALTAALTAPDRQPPRPGRGHHNRRARRR